jgi:hypothetical protein
LVGSDTTVNVRLHERSRALDGAERLLAAVRTGANGKALFIVAEGGMGKTAVLDHVAAMAAPPMRVVTATASLAERDFPFALMEQIAEPSPDDGLLRASEVDPLERRASRHRAVRDQIRRWAALGPVAILLDDLHWADAESLATLGYLARRIERLPVAIIGALRPWPTAAARRRDRRHARPAGHSDVRMPVALTVSMLPFVSWFESPLRSTLLAPF